MASGVLLTSQYGDIPLLKELYSESWYGSSTTTQVLRRIPCIICIIGSGNNVRAILAIYGGSGNVVYTNNENIKVTSVDPSTKTITYNGGSYHYAVAIY